MSRLERIACFLGWHDWQYSPNNGHAVRQCLRCRRAESFRHDLPRPTWQVLELLPANLEDFIGTEDDGSPLRLLFPAEGQS